MRNKPVIIIAAISSRPYVTAATAAGFAVIALDAFADADTQRLARAVYQIACIEDQFDATPLLNILDQLDLNEVVGFCYGAGFEAQPALLEAVAQRLPLVGNTAATVQACKQPQTLFALCDVLSMPYPAFSMHYPANSSGWLRKRIGGSGGGHVLPVTAEQTPDHNVYYQQTLTGTPVSCLFLASAHGVDIIGFNLQWVSATTQQPYRYGGAASQYVLSAQLEQQFSQFVQQAAPALSLIGINSCDAIVHEDAVYLLEINPRLSASLDLYSLVDGHLLAAHVAACQHQPVGPLSVSPIAKAHQVIYAEHAHVISDNVAWPEWACDIPTSDQTVAADMPLCTATAQADDYLAAQQLVAQRATSINLSYSP
ncbi:MAG TPA: ATP-grasp domain-containing protein [Methylophilus sp.]